MTLVHEQFTKVKKNNTIDKTVTRHLIDLFEPYTLENYPFEDVFPIKTGDFPWLRWLSRGGSYQTLTSFCTNGAPGCTPQMTFTFDLRQTGHLGPNDALLHPESSNGWKTEGSLWDRNFKHITEFSKKKKNTGGKHVYNVFEVLLLVPSGGDLALCVVCLFSKAVRLVLLLSFCLKLIFVSRASHMALC